MALQLDYKIRQSSTIIQNAYWKIHRIDFHQKKSIYIGITPMFIEQNNEKIALCECINFGLTAENENFDLFFSNEVLSLENVNIVENAYNYLKTLPEFENAINI